MYSIQPSAELDQRKTLFGICDTMSQALDQYCLGHHEAAQRTLSDLSNQQSLEPRLTWLVHNAGLKMNRMKGWEGRYCRLLGWDFKGTLTQTQLPSVPSILQASQSPTAQLADPFQGNNTGRVSQHQRNHECSLSSITSLPDIAPKSKPPKPEGAKTPTRHRRTVAAGNVKTN